MSPLNSASASVGTRVLHVLHTATLVLAVVALFLRPAFGPSADLWVMMALSLFLLVGAAVDFRTGSTTLVFSTFDRRIDPTGYWVGVALAGALGSVVFCGSMAKLLGVGGGHA